MSRHRQAGKSFSTDGGRHMKIGLQLYTLRGHIKNGDDLLKILSDVKKLGFEGVEFAGYFGLDANTLRSRLDELGLSVAGTHLPVSALEGEPLDENIRFAQTLGSRYIGTGGAPFAGRKERERIARIMGGAYDRAAEYGLCAYYHNHFREFKKREGVYILDTLTAHCAVELDTYWSFYAGVDTPEYIRSHSDRIKLLHIKDGSPRFPQPCALGEGKNDLEGIVSAGKDIGCEWLILENDMPKPDGLSDIARSMDYLKKHFDL